MVNSSIYTLNGLTYLAGKETTLEGSSTSNHRVPRFTFFLFLVYKIAVWENIARSFVVALRSGCDPLARAVADRKTVFAWCCYIDVAVRYMGIVVFFANTGGILVVGFLFKLRVASVTLTVFFRRHEILGTVGTNLVDRITVLHVDQELSLSCWTNVGSALPCVRNQMVHAEV